MNPETKDSILKSIRDKNLIFISAQPDTPYFHWQVEIYMYQFASHGLADRTYALFGYKGSGPSEYVKNLAKKYKVFYYKDDRKNSTYIPSIRPRLLTKFFKEHPELGTNVFYHDSDIFLVKLPRFDLMLNDDLGYLSDTVSYVGYNYLRDKGNEYLAKYPDLPKDDIFNKMIEIIGIDSLTVKTSNSNSGGAQYLLKGITSEFWDEVYTKTEEMYKMFCGYVEKYPIDNEIQKWCTDMWCVLWIYWKSGHKTIVHPELNFSWATDNLEVYNSRNIFHLAGVTDEDSDDKFYKGDYATKNVFIEYLLNPYIFDHVNPDSSTFPYVNTIKAYAEEVFAVENAELIKKLKEKADITIFKLEIGSGADATYIRNKNIVCCGKPTWESTNKQFIMFYNKSSWVITYMIYKDEISETCGGIISNSSLDPTEWTKSDIED